MTPIYESLNSAETVTVSGTTFTYDTDPFTRDLFLHRVSAKIATAGGTGGLTVSTKGSIYRPVTALLTIAAPNIDDAGNEYYPIQPVQDSAGANIDGKYQAYYIKRGEVLTVSGSGYTDGHVVNIELEFVNVPVGDSVT